MGDVISGRLSRMKFQFWKVEIGRNVPDWGVGGCRNGDIGRVGYMTSVLDIIERQDQRNKLTPYVVNMMPRQDCINSIGPSNSFCVHRKFDAGAITNQDVGIIARCIEVSTLWRCGKRGRVRCIFLLGILEASTGCGDGPHISVDINVLGGDWVHDGEG